ncbi:hypothetical protein SISNIDRAFT_468111 [Sistotremastrum niveocremeum HHB9708]|uniref:Uncharacterized protein n=1 Tax=Sistotremastrum niveocremeum HHB9708 TaxID=1314777 RepID=A0A164RTC9_9AGAM|nr:hypothetical protein SISNIDRAFT_468111 [Sistotremastrum niveocremeum HHB9708]
MSVIPWVIHAMWMGHVQQLSLSVACRLTVGRRSVRDGGTVLYSSKVEAQPLTGKSSLSSSRLLGYFDDCPWLLGFESWHPGSKTKKQNLKPTIGSLRLRWHTSFLAITKGKAFPSACDMHEFSLVSHTNIIFGTRSDSMNGLEPQGLKALSEKMLNPKSVQIASKISLGAEKHIQTHTHVDTRTGTEHLGPDPSWRGNLLLGVSMVVNIFGLEFVSFILEPLSHQVTGSVTPPPSTSVSPSWPSPQCQYDDAIYADSLLLTLSPSHGNRDGVSRYRVDRIRRRKRIEREVRIQSIPKSYTDQVIGPLSILGSNSNNTDVINLNLNSHPLHHPANRHRRKSKTGRDQIDFTRQG